MGREKVAVVAWICGICVALAAAACALVIGITLEGRRNGGQDEADTAEGQTYSTYYQVTADALLYQETSEQSAVLKSIPAGTVVTFLGAGADNFYMIQETTDYGYVKQQFLRAVSASEEPADELSEEEPSAPAEAMYEMYVVNCRESITLRARPSMGSEALAQVKKGEQVGYLSAVQNGFVRVLYQGQDGYVLGSYLSYQNQTADTLIKKTMYVVNCQTDISLRSAPDVSAGVMLTIPLHDPVGYIEGADNGFYKISYRGIVGYALASYLADSLPVTREVPVKTLYVVRCDEYITLRNAPARSAGALDRIPLGAGVGYIGTASNGFYKVDYNGRVGYALASYLAENREEAKPAVTPTAVPEPVAEPAEAPEEEQASVTEVPAAEEDDGAGTADILM